MANRARKPDLATEVSRAYSAIRCPKPAPGITCMDVDGVMVCRVPPGVTGLELPSDRELSVPKRWNHDPMANGRPEQCVERDDALETLGGTFDDERSYRSRFRDRIVEGFKLVEEPNGRVPHRWSIERVPNERRRNGSGKR